MQPDPALADVISAFQRGDLDRARALAERQLATSSAPQLLHLLGLIECRRGQLAVGAEWLRRASEAEPENLAYRVMFARALVDSGRAREALGVAQPVGASTPGELALWHVRAEAADAAEEWRASAEAWRKLCAARPDDWRAWRNLADALAAAQRWPEAVQASRRAADLNPAEPELRRALAVALGRMGRFAESAEELGCWIETSDADLLSRLMYARMLADLGRGEDCEAELDKAARLAGVQAFADDADVLMSLAMRPGGELDLAILRELTQLLERTSRTDALETFLSAVEQAGIGRERLGYPAAAAAFRHGDRDRAQRILVAEGPATEPVRWHWLMARIADADGDSARAFSEAVLMNRSEHDFDQWVAAGQAHIELIRELARTVTPEWAAGLKTLPADPRTRLAFLVGFPRSGTTLLDTFLMGHPATVVLEEVPLIQAAQKSLGEFKDLRSRSLAELTEARDHYLDALSRDVDLGAGALIIDKLPLNMLAAPILHALFPDARFIFAERHPCDAVLSCFMQAFSMNASMACFLDIETAAAFYDAAMRLWTNSRESLSIHVHTLIYEELVDAPEKALRPLIDFLDLDWRDELLDHRATAAGRSAIGTPSYNQVTQPLTRAASGRWRRYENELKPVLPVLLPWAERLGYAD